MTFPARRLPADQAVRDAIVTGRGITRIVEAGAGTGKTTLLVDRVLARLADGVPVSRLAIITFTRKAAAELVARVRRSLGELRDRGESWAANALDSFDLALVGTTDSFCRSILTDFALEANVPPGFALADELAQAALLDAAWTRFLTRDGDTERMLKELRAAGIRVKPLREIATELVSNRDLRAATGGTADSTASAEAHEGTDVFARFHAALDDARRLRAACRDPADRLARRVDELVELERTLRSLERPLADRLLIARSRRGFTTTQGRAASWGGRDRKEHVVASLRRIDHVVEELARERGARLTERTVTWLQGYLREYEALKRERGLLDFRDLALATRDLLARHEPVRRIVAARFDEILMDEIQDTDPLQMEIAFLMAARERTADALEADLVPGRLFLVGDPKQSIYRFRRADIELYEKARERIGGAGSVEIIHENFRCAPEIVGFVNDVFGGWMEPEGDERYQARYAELTAARSGHESSGVTLLLPDETLVARASERGPIRAEERRELEIDAVTRLVLRAIGRSGKPLRVRDPISDEERDARPGDVAILVRKIHWGDRLLESLRSAGVSASVAGGKRFYRREEIRTLLALLDAIVREDDRLAQFAALRSAAFGIADDELVRRFLPAPRSGEPSAGIGRTPRADRALERLAELRARARELPVPEFLELLCEELALLAVFGSRPDGAGRVDAIRTLVEAADPLAAAGFDTLPEYVAWLRSQEGEAAVGADDADDGDPAGVQILTMHKSKGLEFPIVILADLAGEPRRGTPVVLNREEATIELRLSEAAMIATPGFEEAAERERLRQDAEDVRLLYVAMTRARDRLVISWPPAKRGFLGSEALAERIGASPGEPAPEGAGIDTLHAGELPALPARQPLGSLALGDGPREPALDPWPEARRVAGRGARVFRATSMGPDRASVSAAGADAPAEAHAAGDDSEDAVRAERGRSVGRLVHAALELFDPVTADTAEAFARARARWERATPPGVGLDGDAVARAQALFERAVADPAVAAVWRAPRIVREVPFLLPVGEDMVSGTIDVVVEGSGGTVSIVDWKTERLRETADRALVRYRPQGLVYAHALGRITGRPVREVRFLFLSSDPVESASFLVDPDFLAEARAVIGSARVRGAPVTIGASLRTSFQENP